MSTSMAKWLVHPVSSVTMGLMHEVERPPSVPEVPTDSREILAKRQARAAKSASTLGEFRTEWNREIREVMKEDWGTAFEQRKRIIDRAVAGNESLRIAPMEVELGGLNTIGGGQGGIRLNQSLAADLGTKRTVEDLRITAAHEAAHGRSVQLHGMLTDRSGKTVDSLLVHEGYAEVVSMEEEGGGIERRRADQPEEVYGEGQRLVGQIIQKAGRAAVDRTLTGDGDLSRLQAAFSDK